MEGMWVYLVSVWAVTVAASEKYVAYPVEKAPHYYEKEYSAGESYEVQKYNRRCGVVPNTFWCERAERSDTAFGEYPWQAAILNGYTNDSFVCSGALLSRSDVLTSATCVKSLPASYLRVRLGEWDIATDRNPKETYKNLELAVVEMKIHPEYYPGADYSPAAYDIAILRLEYPVDFSLYPQISPICLPSHEVDLEYAECFVAGWSESELNKIKVSQFQSRLVDVDFLNAHHSYKKSHPTPQSYPEKPVYNPVKYNAVAKYSYNELPEHRSKASKPSSYKHDVEHVLVASVAYNLTSIPLVTEIDSRTLDDAQVVIGEKYECEESLGIRLQIDQFCMSGINGYDVCKADLGSPVACLIQEPSNYSPSPRYRRDAEKPSFTAGPGSPRDSASARMIVVGVTSLVYPCQAYEGNPAVAIDVVKSLGFILKNLDYDYPY